MFAVGFPNPIGWTIDKVTGFVGDVATDGFELIIGGLVAWVVDAVVWTVGGVFNFFLDSTDPNVEADWFVTGDGPYATTVAVGTSLLLLFVLAGIVQGTLSGDVGGMLRRMGLELPVSILGMVGLVAITQILIRLTDTLSGEVLGHFEHDISEFGAVVATLNNLSSGTATSFVVFVLALVTVLAGLILVAELVVRSALIYIVVALAPLVFAARLWPATRGASRKLLDLLVALIVSKLVIAIALAVAAAAAVGSGSGGEVTSLPEPEAIAEDPGGSATQAVGILLTAAAAFGVSAFSPLLVVRLLPLTEGAVVAQGVKGGPVRAGHQGMMAANTVQMVSGRRYSQIASGRAGSSAAAGGAAESAAGAGASGAASAGAGAAAGPAVVAVVGAGVASRAAKKGGAAATGTVEAARGRTAADRESGATNPDASRGRRGRPDVRPKATKPIGTTTMVAERAERTYRLEPLDSSGVFLGLGVVQCVLVGGGITMGVAALTTGLPLPIAAVPLVVSVAASFTRVGGHASWEWLPLLLGWVVARLRRGRRWVAPLPLWTNGGDDPAQMPPCLEGLDIVEIDWRAAGRLGAVRDRVRQNLTAVVAVSGPQFVVEPRSEQERLLADWGDLLGQYAVERGVVSHLAWSDLARPSGMQDHIRWLDGRDRETPSDAAASSYRELLEAATTTAINHEVVVSITVAKDRLSRHRTGPGTADDQLGRALVTSIEALLRGLRSAGLSFADPLDASGLQRLVRSRIDPVSVDPRARRGRLVERLALVSSSTAGPLVVETRWRDLRVDSAFHRTWWIGTWPRLVVPPAWLEPFLSGGGITRSMTVYFQPVPTHQSRRRIERDLVKLESDAMTKEDKGRRVDARHRRATQALLDREEELVAGFPEMGYAGLVTVSARTEDELDEHSEIVEQLARETGMDLRVLHARQDIGWAASLPLGLAPSTLLAS